VGVGTGAVWQRPQAKLTLEGLAGQDLGHLVTVKSFRFSHQVLDARSIAEGATNSYGDDDECHCYPLLEAWHSGANRHDLTGRPEQPESARTSAEFH